MYIDQDTASAIVFIRAAAGPELPVYFGLIPESFAYPCIFFAQQDNMDSPDTFDTFRSVYTLYTQFFDRTLRGAETLANAARHAVSRANFSIPVLTPEGEKTGRALDVQSNRTSRVQDVPGVAQLTLVWHHYERYEREPDRYFQTFELEQFLQPVSEDSPLRRFLFGGCANGEKDTAAGNGDSLGPEGGKCPCSRPDL